MKVGAGETAVHGDMLLPANAKISPLRDGDAVHNVAIKRLP
ncbi:hypothetical protein [Propionivibrio sp.]|nr:hypothetical protein [Propionivibrio sp.]